MLTPLLSTAQWWIAAIATSAVLMGVVFSALDPAYTVRRKLASALSLPLAGLVVVGGRSMGEDYTKPAALAVYTLGALLLALVVAVIRPWIARQNARHREGYEYEEMPVGLIVVIIAAVALGVGIIPLLVW
ncbi:hypothetical protein ACL02U_19895 [Streptomyces sp. MS06]|uniref:hypothetical protein n=1 Tax=Streptomyces sp. MS06 TaxID=3385974 RepID=UPI00399FCFEF